MFKQHTVVSNSTKKSNDSAGMSTGTGTVPYVRASRQEHARLLVLTPVYTVSTVPYYLYILYGIDAVL